MSDVHSQSVPGILNDDFDTLFDDPDASFDDLDASSTTPSLFDEIPEQDANLQAGVGLQSVHTLQTQAVNAPQPNHDSQGQQVFLSQGLHSSQELYSSQELCLPQESHRPQNFCQPQTPYHPQTIQQQQMLYHSPTMFNSAQLSNFDLPQAPEPLPPRIIRQWLQQAPTRVDEYDQLGDAMTNGNNVEYLSNDHPSTLPTQQRGVLRTVASSSTYSRNHMINASMALRPHSGPHSDFDVDKVDNTDETEKVAVIFEYDEKTKKWRVVDLMEGPFCWKKRRDKYTSHGMFLDLSGAIPALFSVYVESKWSDRFTRFTQNAPEGCHKIARFYFPIGTTVICRSRTGNSDSTTETIRFAEESHFLYASKTSFSVQDALNKGYFAELDEDEIAKRDNWVTPRDSHLHWSGRTVELRSFYLLRGTHVTDDNVRVDPKTPWDWGPVNTSKRSRSISAEPREGVTGTAQVSRGTAQVTRGSKASKKPKVNSSGRIRRAAHFIQYAFVDRTYRDVDAAALLVGSWTEVKDPISKSLEKTLTNYERYPFLKPMNYTEDEMELILAQALEYIQNQRKTLDHTTSNALLNHISEPLKNKERMKALSEDQSFLTEKKGSEQLIINKAIETIYTSIYHHSRRFHIASSELESPQTIAEILDVDHQLKSASGAALAAYLVDRRFRLNATGKDLQKSYESIKDYLVGVMTKFVESGLAFDIEARDNIAR